MHDELVSARVASRLLGGALAVCLAPFGAANAFPTVDPSNSAAVPGGGGAPFGVELHPRDVEGLQAQQKLTSQTPPTNKGWTIVPRITVQEMFTDNALEVKSPRRFDMVTVIAPGISINADTPRVQLKLDYQPNLLLHAINGPLNAVTQQLNMVGLFTVIPDLAYVDVRGLSGVQSRLGGLSGSGSLGSIDSGPITTGSISAAAAGGNGASSSQGLNRQNEVQTTSLGISPYLLRRFGEYGTGKLGASVNASSYSSLSGFIGNPLPFSTTGGQSILTTEQIAQFTSGEILGRFQSTLTANLSQSSIRTDALPGLPKSMSSSKREIFNDQMSFALNRTFKLLGSVGHEFISYSNGAFPTINGLTWNVGLTVTPNPDSSLTITYGRQNGSDAVNSSGYYAITPRTLLSFDYTNTVGTQLENLQNQLNNTFIGANGQAFNAITGGPAFIGSNANGAQTGLFRFNTFNASLQTTWQRDTLTGTLSWSNQTRTGAGNGVSTEVRTASLAWVHELAPDLTMSTGASFSSTKRAGRIGNDTAFSAAAGLRYAVTDSTTLSARYSFFDRVSGIPGYSVYENILLVGITKQF